MLPGHCAEELKKALLAFGAGGDPGDDEAALRAAIEAIPGLGARRRALYLEALVALGRTQPEASKASAKIAPPGARDEDPPDSGAPSAPGA